MQIYNVDKYMWKESLLKTVFILKNNYSEFDSSINWTTFPPPYSFVLVNMVQSKIWVRNY